MNYRVSERTKIRQDSGASYCHRPNAIVMTPRLDYDTRGVPLMAERVVEVAPASTTLQEA
jgi:hypothetical protein